MQMRHLAKGAIGAMVILLGAHASASALTGEMRDRYSKSSMESCVRSAKANNPTLAEEKIQAYCSCFTEAAADMTTVEDIGYIAQNKTVPDDYKKRIDPIIAACRSKVVD
jgi:hypothetical protein